MSFFILLIIIGSVKRVPFRTLPIVICGHSKPLFLSNSLILFISFPKYGHLIPILHYKMLKAASCDILSFVFSL